MKEGIAIDNNYGQKNGKFGLGSLSLQKLRLGQQLFALSIRCVFIYIKANAPLWSALMCLKYFTLSIYSAMLPQFFSLCQLLRRSLLRLKCETKQALSINVNSPSPCRQKDDKKKPEKRKSNSDQGKMKVGDANGKDSRKHQLVRGTKVVPSKSELEGGFTSTDFYRMEKPFPPSLQQGWPLKHFIHYL